MKKVNTTHESALNAGNEPPDCPGPSLDELISEIDNQIGTASLPMHEQNAQNEVLSATVGYGERQYVRFSLNETNMAIPLSRVLEIGHLPDITSLPNLPGWILGVCNIRGEVVSMVDLKRFFGMPSQGAARNGRYLIIGNPQIKLGLTVDRIMGILRMDKLQTQMQAAPYSEKEIAPFIKGVVVQAKRLLNVIDADKLLSAPKMIEI